MSGQDEKPFDIPKRLVWQAWKRVAENGGAPGADGVTIEDFKTDLGNNLYKIWLCRVAGARGPLGLLAAVGSPDRLGIITVPRGRRAARREDGSGRVWCWV